MNKTVEKETVFAEYHGKVQRYISGKVSNHQDAEDLASDVFVKVFEKLDSFDSEKASLSTWIYTITRNTVTDYYRTHKEHGELDEQLLSSFDLEGKVVGEEMLEKLADALEQLDRRSRQIIISRYYSGRTLKDIADHLDISYAYVKILHNAALAKLKQYLQ